MQRLFSTFPNEWPGAGLLLLRLACGTPLIVGGISAGYGAPHALQLAVPLTAVVSGTLLLLGLWTPYAGALAMLIELRFLILRNSYEGSHIQLAALAASLAMLGPGAWSIDARLFGRRRIDLNEKN